MSIINGIIKLYKTIIKPIKFSLNYVICKSIIIYSNTTKFSGGDANVAKLLCKEYHDNIVLLKSGSCKGQSAVTVGKTSSILFYG